ncbi:hypothetical protein IGB42_01936 [Andreprevotia sp. IGB-42]|uniref:hypothetical protein n=1 Tax=Andreprevotia sp. IGB-42 TaxID=2497473 RepID=UPI00135A2E15|nr:hypothetical protein [Andreprevotia sp. IGB-42]KAF0813585.1 hypothetical protein IGB42_01936 [Andreprevotia sp. IGB-42]
MFWLGVLGFLLAFCAIPAAIVGGVILLTTRENQQRLSGHTVVEAPRLVGQKNAQLLELASYIIFGVITVPSCVVAIPLLLVSLFFVLGIGNLAVIMVPVIVFTLAGFAAIWRLHWTYLARGFLPVHRWRYIALLGSGGLLCVGVMLPMLKSGGHWFLIWPISSVLFYLVLLLVLKPRQQHAANAD